MESLGADVAAGIRRIKATAGPDLIVWGSPTLTPVLIEHELAEEIVLLVFPVVLGNGKRFFESTPAREFFLVASKPTASGDVISTYKPNGVLRTGSMAG